MAMAKTFNRRHDRERLVWERERLVDISDFDSDAVRQSSIPDQPLSLPSLWMRNRYPSCAATGLTREATNRTAGSATQIKHPVIRVHFGYLGDGIVRPLDGFRQRPGIVRP